MFRVGSILNISLQDELRIWSLLGIVNLSIQLFWPATDLWERLLLRVCSQPFVIYILECCPLFLKTLWQLNLGFYNDMDRFECNIMRVYILTYICMIYPLYTRRRAFMLGPWIVMAGFSFFKPYIIPRLYVFVLVFGYWSWMLDEKSLETKISIRKKEKEKLDEVAQGVRRLAKGIRGHLVNCHPEDILMHHENENNKDFFEYSSSSSAEQSSVNSRSASFEEDFIRNTPMQMDTSLTSEIYSYGEMTNFYSERRGSNFSEMTRTSDCIKVQFAQLFHELLICKSNEKTFSMIVNEKKLSTKTAMNEETDSTTSKNLATFLSYPFPATGMALSSNSTSKKKTFLQPDHITMYPGIFSKQRQSDVLSLGLKFNLVDTPAVSPSKYIKESRRSSVDFGANFPDFSKRADDSCKKNICICNS